MAGCSSTPTDVYLIFCESKSLKITNCGFMPSSKLYTVVHKGVNLYSSALRMFYNEFLFPICPCFHVLTVKSIVTVYQITGMVRSRTFLQLDMPEGELYRKALAVQFVFLKKTCI
jgi:hypothetical protein